MKKINNEAGRESAWDYPLPPRVENFHQRIRVFFNGEQIANSVNAKRVLERGHPPVYYLPIEDVDRRALQPSAKRTWCEWKGEASYYDVTAGNQVSENAAWFYPNPTADFAAIANHVAFYAGKMEACFVGDETVKPQSGSFYGGWITPNIAGPFKGSPAGRE
jgi:uncharacterized protein (DUF427 family)